MTGVNDRVIEFYDQFLEKLHDQQNFVGRHMKGALDEEAVKGLFFTVLQVAGFAGGGGNAQAGLNLVTNRHKKFAHLSKDESDRLMKTWRAADHKAKMAMLLKPMKLIAANAASDDKYDLMNRYYCMACMLATPMYSAGGLDAEEAFLPMRKAMDDLISSTFGSHYIYHRHVMLDKLGFKLSDFDGASSTPHAPEVAGKPDDAPQAADAPKTPAKDAAKPAPAAPAASEALADLDSLVGLADVKKEMNDLRALLMLHQRQKAFGMKTSLPALHMVFTGNPGTGKTTIARAVGKIVKELGVLKKGHVVECDRSHLVADYLGQTAGKTNRKIDEAMDGILFIDEAYTLARDKQDQYGQEAIDTLLKRMEDNRDRLIVIVAGYPAPMSKFIDSNPGLKSRFTRTVFFPDYSRAELGEIFDRMATDKGYTVEAPARDAALAILDRERAERPEQFGNARDARTLMEMAIQQLAARLQNDGSLARTDISDDEAKTLFTTLTLADVDAVSERFGRDVGRAAHTPPPVPPAPPVPPLARLRRP